MVHLQRGQNVNFRVLELILKYLKATSLIHIVPPIPESETLENGPLEFNTVYLELVIHAWPLTVGRKAG